MWFQVKARAVWLFGVALALAGISLTAHGLGLFLWQYATRLQLGVWVRLPAKLSFADHALLRGSNVDPVLEFIPQLRSAWVSDPQSWLATHEVVMWLLDQAHIGLISGLLGLLTAAAGVVIAIRQRAVLDAAKRRDADRLRRVQQYRGQ